jgi:hypothetical protein
MDLGDARVADQAIGQLPFVDATAIRAKQTHRDRLNVAQHRHINLDAGRDVAFGLRALKQQRIHLSPLQNFRFEGIWSGFTIAGNRNRSSIFAFVAFSDGKPVSTFPENALV